MKYYISDMHFGHANILRHSKRPFTTVEEMDETMITNWNNVVSADDEVYILGDICFKAKHPEDYLSRLNGKKYLVIGNHDKPIVKNPTLRKHFEQIRDIMYIEDGENRIVACHYPMVEWDGFFRGTIHLYGHIHNNTSNQAYDIMKTIQNAYNVGVDITDFTPRTLAEVIEYNKKL